MTAEWFERLLDADPPTLCSVILASFPNTAKSILGQEGLAFADLNNLAPSARAWRHVISAAGWQQRVASAAAADWQRAGPKGNSGDNNTLRIKEK